MVYRFNPSRGFIFSLPDENCENLEAINTAKKVIKSNYDKIKNIEAESDLSSEVIIRRYHKNLGSIIESVYDNNPDYLCVLSAILEHGYSVKKNVELARDIIYPLYRIHDYQYAKQIFIRIIANDTNQKEELLKAVKELCEANHVPSILLLSQMYQHGYGVIKSEKTEWDLLCLAKAHGSIWAKRRILEISLKNKRITYPIFCISIFKLLLKFGAMQVKDGNDDRLW